MHAGTHGYPYTGFFFNARGDEGQYITRDEWGQGGPLKRVKVTLHGDQGFAMDFPAVATITRTDRNFNSEDIDVEADPGICQVGPSAPEGEVVPDPGDTCGPTGMSGHRNGLSIISVTETYTDKTLVCVDYRGNEEVFCELMPPQNEIVQSTVGDSPHSAADRERLVLLSSRSVAQRCESHDQHADRRCTHPENRKCRSSLVLIQPSQYEREILRRFVHSARDLHWVSHREWQCDEQNDEVDPCRCAP